jgi:hypothetical protein
VSARYGGEHKRLRRCWAKDVARGVVLCARCGRLIVPGTAWDLGHDDADPSRYSGPEHRRCNRATSAHRAARKRRSPASLVAFLDSSRKSSRIW